MKDIPQINEEKVIKADQLLEEAWENMNEEQCGTAKPLADNAVTIYRTLAYENPVLYDPMLAYAYNTLGMAYVFMNLLDYAEDACARAVFFARKSYNQNTTDDNLRLLAKYLYSYGFVLQNEEHLDCAYNALHEAAEILNGLKENGSDHLSIIHKEVLVLCDVIGEQVIPDYWNHQLNSMDNK